jgi:hypothetical protein
MKRPVMSAGAIWPLSPTVPLPQEVQQLARHAYVRAKRPFHRMFCYQTQPFARQARDKEEEKLKSESSFSPIRVDGERLLDGPSGRPNNGRTGYAWADWIDNMRAPR